MRTISLRWVGVALLAGACFVAQAASPQNKSLRVFLNNKTVGVDDVVHSLDVTLGRARVDGVVEGNARVRFGELEVNGAVNGQVQAVCAVVKINGGVGERGVQAEWADIIIHGTVRGPVTVRGGTVRVAKGGLVEGRVTIDGGSFDGDRSRVQGGVTIHNTFNTHTHLGEGVLGFVVALLLGLGVLMFGWWIALLVSLASLLFYLLLALMFRGTLERRHSLFPEENIGLDFLAGLLAIASGFLLAGGLCVSCIGIPLLLLLPVIYLLAYWFGMLTLGYIVGQMIWRHVFKSNAGYFATVLAGLIALLLSRWVPLFGGILNVCYTVLAIGITARWIYDAHRAPVPPKVA